MDPGSQRDTDTLGTALGLRQRLASRILTLGSAFRNKSCTKIREAAGGWAARQLYKSPQLIPWGSLEWAGPSEMSWIKAWDGVFVLPHGPVTGHWLPRGEV